MSATEDRTDWTLDRDNLDYLRAIYEPLAKGEPLPEGAWDDPAVDVPATMLGLLDRIQDLATQNTALLGALKDLLAASDGLLDAGMPQDWRPMAVASSRARLAITQAESTNGEPE